MLHFDVLFKFKNVAENIDDKQATTFRIIINRQHHIKINSKQYWKINNFPMIHLSVRRPLFGIVMIA